VAPFASTLPIVWEAAARLPLSDVTAHTITTAVGQREVMIPAEGVTLAGQLSLPEAPVGAVVFAHGSGSSRLSPRNVAVAEHLQRGGLATLLFDLLTEEEALSRANVFDVPLLAHRLGLATQWLRAEADTSGLRVGYLGASTGAAAALWAAAGALSGVAAIVSRGGQPDLAGPRLPLVQAPTLLIVGGADQIVLELNRAAVAALRSCEHELVVVPGASHLFEEPGALEQVAGLAKDWFHAHLSATP
jgi:putative phosphoribosyl transferase